MSEFEDCIRAGGLAVFPSDTVYGIACDPFDRFAVQRLYLLKRRPLEKPSAVMWFDLEAALGSLSWLGRRTRAALRRMLPGGVSLLLPNPSGHYPLACGSDPRTLGVRVPVVSFDGGGTAVLQSSANLAGRPDPRVISDVPELLRAAADLVVDGGELPGTPSTVIDLRGYEDAGEWSIVRQGAVEFEAVAGALAGGAGGGALGGGAAGTGAGAAGTGAGEDGQFHFDPAGYLDMIRNDISVFDEFQDAVVSATGEGAQRILELGTGTGETARRLLARHTEATLVGIDASAPMLAAARSMLPAERVDLRTADISGAFPDGQFDLVASALCVHHLTSEEKAELFSRVRSVLLPGGRFVLGDVVIPADPADAATSLTPGFDRPDTVEDQLRWLRDAGFEASVAWVHRDLAVIVAEFGGPGPCLPDAHRPEIG